MADWTVDEARGYLPRLRGLIEIIRRAAVVSVRARSNGHRARAPGEGAAPDSAGSAGAEDPSTAADTELPDIGPADALGELEARGIVLRDIERGLVDFPSRHPGGREVFLCWQLGDPDLAWWHLPEEGFAGRRPLPLPPEL